MITFASLSLQRQAALSWVVNVGGVAPSSLAPALHGLAATGHATAHPDGTWAATDAGRALLPAHKHRNYDRSPDTDTEAF